MVNPVPVRSIWEAAQFVLSPSKPELSRTAAYLLENEALYIFANSIIMSRDLFQYSLGLTAATGIAFYFANRKHSNWGRALSGTALALSVVSVAVLTQDLYIKAVAVQSISGDVLRLLAVLKSH